MNAPAAKTGEEPENVPILETTRLAPAPGFIFPSGEASHGKVRNVDSTTDAPSIPSGKPASGSTRQAGRMALPAAGDVVDDFELLQVLGEGSFGRVFLARQLSLGRQVALKVSANRSSEARTLASLEHDHIIHVFSETVAPAGNLRLLCMQYVPGTGLDAVIRFLGRLDEGAWSGGAILRAIDELSTQPVALDPAALRDREFLGACDHVEAVCWIGGRLAEALAHAHARGILHRDIKPANILLNRYGRPMLADFNLALDLNPGSGIETFGGTLAYMAPEHLDAFNPEGNTPRTAVDQLSDLYALGIVLFELSTGDMPFDNKVERTHLADDLRKLAAERRAGAPSPRRLKCWVPAVLDRTIRRCLAPRPELRYHGAGELAEALEGCRELQRINRELPVANRLTRAMQQRPFLWLIVLTLLPHLVGSAVNISYNALRIVGDLTVAQQTTFLYLVLGYNVVAYGAALAISYHLVMPIFRTWRRLTGTEAVIIPEMTAIRRRALTLPIWTGALSCLGWLPGGLLFPMTLHWLEGPLGIRVFGHFLFSFTISGLIALTYSVLAVQYVVLRGWYPRLWVDGKRLRALIAEELASEEERPRILQLLAGLIPLAGAVLMVGAGPERLTVSYRLLVTSLIALGMAGFGLAMVISHRLQQTLTVLLGQRRNLPLREL